MIVLAYGMWSTGTIRSAIFPEIPGRYITAKVALEDGAPLPLQKQALDKIEQSMLSVEQQLQATTHLANHRSLTC